MIDENTERYANGMQRLGSAKEAINYLLKEAFLVELGEFDEDVEDLFIETPPVLIMLAFAFGTLTPEDWSRFVFFHKWEEQVFTLYLFLRDSKKPVAYAELETWAQVFYIETLDGYWDELPKFAEALGMKCKDYDKCEPNPGERVFFKEDNGIKNDTFVFDFCH